MEACGAGHFVSNRSPTSALTPTLSRFAGGKPTGRLIALQIKSGASYFAEPAEGGWLHRDHDAHLIYWLRHAGMPGNNGRTGDRR